MSFADVRRSHIAWMIQQNPTEITINRVEKVRKGGGFDEVESTHGPFTVRIFTKRTQTPSEVQTLAGRKQVDTQYSLLADEHADIQSGPNVTDTFEALGWSFEVIDVRPQMWQGEVVGYQVALERVK